MSNFNEFSKEVFEANKLKGFDVSKNNIGQTLMLVVSELAEALEADRKDKRAKEKGLKFLEEKEKDEWDRDFNETPEHFKKMFELYIKDSFEDEIADSFIRLFDLVGGLEIDIDFHIAQKRRYNSLRPHMHGKAY